MHSIRDDIRKAEYQVTGKKPMKAKLKRPRGKKMKAEKAPLGMGNVPVAKAKYR